MGEKKIKPSGRYFHGGVRGLRVGDFVLPPCETKAVSAQDVGPESLRSRARAVHRMDRVYLGTMVEVALIFASMAPGGGAVYEVDPVAPIEEDLDFHGPSGVSVCAPRARIIAVKPFTQTYLEGVRRGVFGL